MRTKTCWMVLGMTAFVAAGCGGSGFRSTDRMARLMELAAAEAGRIDRPLERFKRQLNVAEMQIDRYQRVDAIATLRDARQTIQSHGETFGEHLHIAGWVSLCELSRRAKREPFAGECIDRAITLLRAVDPQAQRMQYVLGVAREVRLLRGKAASAKLLREAIPWAAGLSPKEERRDALSGLAAGLFLCDDYDGGMLALRRDSDAAWRTDTLARMATQATPGKYGSVLFGKTMTYKSNFQISKPSPGR